MKQNTLTPSLVIAAMTAQYMRHFTFAPDGFGINRQIYRKHYGKKKGGRHGNGFLVKNWRGCPAVCRGNGR